tara:strand:- start:115 stop:495 length:381 start_codon:yes stop_codon:yes gene_type:complete
MDHQDWKPVIFNKPKKKIVVKNKKKVLSDDQIRKIKLDNDNEVHKIEKVSMDFRKEMQKARCAKNMTQKQLAQKLNLKQTIIANYEQGKAVPNNYIITKIERALGVKLPRKKKKTKNKEDKDKKKK